MSHGFDRFKGNLSWHYVGNGHAMNSPNPGRISPALVSTLAFRTVSVKSQLM